MLEMRVKLPSRWEDNGALSAEGEVHMKMFQQLFNRYFCDDFKVVSYRSNNEC